MNSEGQSSASAGQSSATAGQSSASAGQSESGHSLRSTLQAKMDQLQKAVSKIALTKKHLRQNAQEVKTEIQSSVSRQLEVLRSREVHLLAQVEVLQGAKDQLLSDQQHSLHQALGGLHSLAQPSTHDHSLNNHISHSLQRLDNLDLCPEEDADIQFMADTCALRQSIHQFGSVCTSPMSTFSHQGAASLPKAFEDYEDEAEHIMYKPVQSPNVGVSVLGGSLRPEDWLLYSSHVDQPTQPQPHFVFPPFQSSETSQWLAGSAACASSAASLQQWLQDLQHQTQMEEEDVGGFDGFARTTPGNKPEDEPMAEVDIQSITLPYFKHVAQTPPDSWLVSTEMVAEGNKCLDYFLTLPSDPSYWLLTPQQKEPVCTASCASTPDVVDIESLAERLHCTQLSTPTWLSPDHDKDVDELDSPGTQHLCRANEPCDTFADCVCDENCCDMGMVQWLATGSVSEAYERLPYFNEVRVQECGQWLIDEGTDDKNKGQGWSEGMDEKNKSQWLADEGTDEKNKGQWLTEGTDEKNKGQWLTEDTDEKNKGQWLADEGTDEKNKGQWLAEAQSNDDDNVSTRFPPFNNSTTTNQWLLEDTSNISDSDPPPSHVTTSEWLAPLNTNTNFACPNFDNLAGMSTTDTKSWLVKSLMIASEAAQEIKSELGSDGCQKGGVQCKDSGADCVGVLRLKQNYAHWLLPAGLDKAKELPESMEEALSHASANNEVSQCFKEHHVNQNINQWLLGAN